MDKEIEQVESFEEINQLSGADLQNAVDFYIQDLTNKMKELEKINFDNFEKLSNLSLDITLLEAEIYDGEVFLKEKDSDNPRELRDSIDEKESKKAKILIDIQISKEELTKLKSQADAVRKSIKDNDIEALKLSKRIDVAKEYLANKLKEQK